MHPPLLWLDDHRDDRLPEPDAVREWLVLEGYNAARHRADALTAQLDSLSPLSVLGRGYSLTRRLEDGLLVRTARELAVEDTLVTRFAQGEAVSRVESLTPD